MNYKDITVDFVPPPPTEAFVTVRMPLSTASVLRKVLEAGVSGAPSGPRGRLDALIEAFERAGIPKTICRSSGSITLYAPE